MRRVTLVTVAAAVLAAASAYPVFADANKGNSEWTKKEQKLESKITDTLQTFVPQVQSVDGSLTAQLGGQGTTVTSSVYLPQTVLTDIAAIQSAASQLQTSDPSALQQALKSLQTQIEHARELLSHAKEHANESAKSSQNHLKKLQSTFTAFTQDVATLQSADSTLQADPTSHTSYDAANKAWQRVQHDGKKILEWSREWSSSKKGN